MDEISPLLHDAFGMLQTDLYGQLDDREFLACKTQEWTDDDIEAARKLIPDLVTVIRVLVIEHQVRPNAECRICGSAWPCPVVTAIHGLLKDPQGQYLALVTRAHAAQ